MNARRNATGRPASEIREAMETMETPSYCPDCGEFRDATGQTCPECGGDSLLSYRDAPYYLECAEEDESPLTIPQLHELHAEANRIDEERRYMESA